MPADNVRGETFEEHNIYMNELLKSLTAADKNGITEDPFISVKKTCREFKECVTYYAVANGFSLWYERSCEARVVAKCGQRPPRLSDPEKGKQRKQTRYPSASIDEFTTCPWRCYASGLQKSLVIRDGNNHIYPVAWVVVNVENKDIWTWFLELLLENLGSSRGNGLTLMSDQHKSLMEVVKDVMPNAEHRQCARHIYENFRKQYLELEFRQLFMATSKASYPQLFNKIMDKIKIANPNGHKYLMDKNPKTWSRAFFDVDR
ncbi:pentatricopeptide repeat-containing protein, partial [Tanacetum coccineum]